MPVLWFSVHVAWQTRWALYALKAFYGSWPHGLTAAQWQGAMSVNCILHGVIHNIPCPNNS